MSNRINWLQYMNGIYVYYSVYIAWIVKRCMHDEDHFTGLVFVTFNVHLAQRRYEDI